ncbi:MAG TPA: hypothetical protein VF540_01875 [Segetibacter sp.]
MPDISYYFKRVEDQVRITKAVVENRSVINSLLAVAAVVNNKSWIGSSTSVYCSSLPALRLQVTTCDRSAVQHQQGKKSLIC